MKKTKGMTIEEVFFNTFVFINLYEDKMRKPFHKKAKLKVSKQDKRILYNIYVAYDIHLISFHAFKLMCIENAISTQSDLITSCVDIAEIIKEKN